MKSRSGFSLAIASQPFQCSTIKEEMSMAHLFNQELNTALAVFAKPVRKCFLQNQKFRAKLDVRAHFVFLILLILQTHRKLLAVRVCQVAAAAQGRQPQHLVAASKLHLR